MTREEQIKQAARDIALNWNVGRGNEFYYRLDKLTEMARWADEHPKSPWIDINVKLPEVKKRVLFLCNNGKAYFGYNNIDNESATITNAPDGVKVTHWMPIPELPKEDKNN